MKYTDLHYSMANQHHHNHQSPNLTGNPQYGITIYKLQSHKLVKHYTRCMYFVTIIPKYI